MSDDEGFDLPPAPSAPTTTGSSEVTAAAAVSAQSPSAAALEAPTPTSAPSPAATSTTSSSSPPPSKKPSSSVAAAIAASAAVRAAAAATAAANTTSSSSSSSLAHRSSPVWRTLLQKSYNPPFVSPSASILHVGGPAAAGPSTTGGSLGLLRKFGSKLTLSSLTTRHFLLSNHSLQYHRDNPFRNPQGSVGLAGARIAPIGDEELAGLSLGMKPPPSAGCGFSVTARGESRKYIFVCDDALSCTIWMDLLSYSSRDALRGELRPQSLDQWFADPRLVLEGWATKLGADPKAQSWKRRYVVYTRATHTLQYFKQHTPRALGFVPLEPGVVVDVVKGASAAVSPAPDATSSTGSLNESLVQFTSRTLSSLPPSFVAEHANLIWAITPSPERCYVLVAPTAAERDEWIEAIAGALRYAAGQGTSWEGGSKRKQRLMSQVATAAAVSRASMVAATTTTTTGSTSTAPIHTSSTKDKDKDKERESSTTTPSKSASQSSSNSKSSSASSSANSSAASTPSATPQVVPLASPASPTLVAVASTSSSSSSSSTPALPMRALPARASTVGSVSAAGPATNSTATAAAPTSPSSSSSSPSPSSNSTQAGGGGSVKFPKTLAPSASQQQQQQQQQASSPDDDWDDAVLGGARTHGQSVCYVSLGPPSSSKFTASSLGAKKHTVTPPGGGFTRGLGGFKPSSSSSTTAHSMQYKPLPRGGVPASAAGLSPPLVVVEDSAVLEDDEVGMGPSSLSSASSSSSSLSSSSSSMPGSPISSMSSSLAFSAPLGGGTLASSSSPRTSTRTAPSSIASSRAGSTTTNSSDPPHSSNTSMVEKILSELYSTESSYVAGLHSLCSGYLLRFRKMVELNLDPRNPWFEEGEFERLQIFQHATAIRDINARLLKELQAINDEGAQGGTAANSSATMTGDGARMQHLARIGSTFRQFIPFLKVYSLYASSYDDVRTVESLAEKRPGLKVFLQLTAACEGATFASLMITPVQRLGRYVMLLETILKHAPRTTVASADSHSGAASTVDGLADVSLALEEMKKVATLVNSTVAMWVATNKVVELQAKLDTPIIQPGRFLVREGVLKKLYRRERAGAGGAGGFFASISSSMGMARKEAPFVFFLLNDALMQAKKSALQDRFALKAIMPLHGMVIEDVPESEAKHAWTITYIDAVPGPPPPSQPAQQSPTAAVATSTQSALSSSTGGQTVASPSSESAASPSSSSSIISPPDSALQSNPAANVVDPDDPLSSSSSSDRKTLTVFARDGEEKAKWMADIASLIEQSSRNKKTLRT